MRGEVKVGCCGFPVSLTRYAQMFPVVEVQQTFYQPPRVATLEKWRTQAPPEFEFTIKAWQLITHECSSPTYRRLRQPLSEQERREAGSFRATNTVIKAWETTLECARTLGSRVILFQSPARFAPTPENKAQLRTFFKLIGRPDAASAGGATPMAMAWEPRGAWTTEEIAELCSELGLLHAVDPLIQVPATRGIGYFRLHGGKHYKQSYSEADLKKVLRQASQHTGCYVFFNNLGRLGDAQKFIRLMEGGPGC
jgi:uncharacterized protein YecE (DUF72 family)